MCSCTSTDRRAPFLDFFFFFGKANKIPARLRYRRRRRLYGGHPRRPPSSCPPTHHLVCAWDGAPSSRDKRHPGWLLRVFCLSDCPSVFVCFSVVEPCTSVQLPTLLLLCISERRVRERERERERKKEELIGQQYSHFALCVPVLYVRARALTRFCKTASFVVVHKEKKWPRTQCKT